MRKIMLNGQWELAEAGNDRLCEVQILFTGQMRMRQGNCSGRIMNSAEHLWLQRIS